ncbi:hypothetical protein GMOD_00005490 [Pyrenophora seminiperda CCB06]|uniref:Uncharacterized protein n=1 Tax=Pyrenophora seminiperda CCB06 TaxID=1302712 RepID=A0A3M7LW40_9PLEO|nr:hypothetical protein GMOD_00005490 [Pyrenophora seminiperda CCB06]
MPAPVEVQAATLEKFIEGWKGWTPEGFLASFADNCTQITLPFRNGDGKPKTKAELVGLFPILMSTLSNFKVS